MNGRKNPRQVGLVAAVAGIVTQGMPSPYALVLCAEKLWETDRERAHRVGDVAGVALAVAGTAVLPRTLGVWKIRRPEDADALLIYLAVFAVWMAHRAFVVWRSGVTGPWATAAVTQTFSEDVPPEDGSDCRALEDVIREARIRPRLAGLVMAVVGLVSFGVSSPFALVLSAEKLWEPGRTGGRRICDIVGVVLAWFGNIVISIVLYQMWLNPGPGLDSETVIIYAGFFAVWMAHRVFVVWRSGVTGPWAIDLGDSGRS